MAEINTTVAATVAAAVTPLLPIQLKYLQLLDSNTGSYVIRCNGDLPESNGSLPGARKPPVKVFSVHNHILNMYTDYFSSVSKPLNEDHKIVYKTLKYMYAGVFDVSDYKTNPDVIDELYDWLVFVEKIGVKELGGLIMRNIIEIINARDSFRSVFKVIDHALARDHDVIISESVKIISRAIRGRTDHDCRHDTAQRCCIHKNGKPSWLPSIDVDAIDDCYNLHRTTAKVINTSGCCKHYYGIVTQKDIDMLDSDIAIQVLREVVA